MSPVHKIVYNYCTGTIVLACAGNFITKIMVSHNLHLLSIWTTVSIFSRKNSDMVLHTHNFQRLNFKLGTICRHFVSQLFYHHVNSQENKTGGKMNEINSSTVLLQNCIDLIDRNESIDCQRHWAKKNVRVLCVFKWVCAKFNWITFEVGSQCVLVGVGIDV